MNVPELRSSPFQPSPDLPPPLMMRGTWGWLRENLFSSWLSAFLTLGSVFLLAWFLPGLIRYLFIDAIWSASDGEPCRAPGAGACWAYVGAKLTFFTYGAYPRDQLWRVNTVMASGAVLAVWLLWPAVKGKGLAAILFFAVFPIVGFGLLSGRTPFPDLLLPQPGSDSEWWAFRAAIGLAALALLLMSWRRFLPGGILLFLVGWFLAAAHWRYLGLSRIDTDLWGGIFVSLLVASVGIVFSLPCGILLALGRRSRLPVIRFLSIVLIEVVRGVPLITVLFMANTMLPLFVPDAWSPDRLLRPLIGVALFSSVYMAEVVRGGLEAVPRGQYEAAMAVGLNWRRMMMLVALPQALTAVIPGIVNSFIALFKDTTLVAIVGIFDFLRAVDTQRLDPAWAGPNISATGYIFAAAFYFVFCFAMSRYSQMMERRHAAGRKR